MVVPDKGPQNVKQQKGIRDSELLPGARLTKTSDVKIS